MAYKKMYSSIHRNKDHLQISRASRQIWWPSQDVPFETRRVLSTNGSLFRIIHSLRDVRLDENETSCTSFHIIHFQVFYKYIKIWSLIVVNERGKKHTHTHTRVYNKNILLLFRFFGCIKTFGSLAANVTYVTAIT